MKTIKRATRFIWLYLQISVAVLRIFTALAYLWMYLKVAVWIHRCKFWYQLRKHRIPKDLRKNLYKNYVIKMGISLFLTNMLKQRVLIRMSKDRLTQGTF